jgi:hypothetical protein
MQKMGKRNLRSFLYLDESVVDDYLSQIEGGILNASMEELRNE